MKKEISFTGPEWYGLTRGAIISIASQTPLDIQKACVAWRSTAKGALDGPHEALLGPLLLPSDACLDDVLSFILGCYIPKWYLNKFEQAENRALAGQFRESIRVIAPLITCPDDCLLGYVDAIKKFAHDKNINKAIDTAVGRGRNEKRIDALEVYLKQEIDGFKDWVTYSLGRAEKHRAATILEGISYFGVKEVVDGKQMAATILSWAIDFAGKQIDDEVKRAAWMSSCEGRLSVLTEAEVRHHRAGTFVEVSRIRGTLGPLIINGLQQSYERKLEGGRLAPMTDLFSFISPLMEAGPWSLQVTLCSTTGELIENANQDGYLEDVFTSELLAAANEVRVLEHRNSIDKVLVVTVDFHLGFYMNRQFW